MTLEGYPRSGNSYLWAAFRVANGADVHLASHTHAPAQVFRAARFGVPTVVLVRNPRDAITSYLIFYRAARPSEAIRLYIDFYRSIWTIRDQILVIGFDRAMSSVSDALSEASTYFDVDLARYENNDKNASAVEAMIEEANRRESGGLLVEETVGRPSPSRDAAKADIRELLDSPELEALLVEAEKIYKDFSDLEQEQQSRATKQCRRNRTP